MPELTLQLSLMVVEAAFAAGVLLALFSARKFIGFAPLYTTVGVFYYLATLLAGTTFIKVTPGLLMSPGSVALFPACLFAVLLIYIREDAKDARNMIYGLLAANVAASLLGLLVAQHMNSSLAFNPLSLPPELFALSPRLFLVGTLALYTDTILIILVYEAVSRVLRPLFFRAWVSLALVLVFDTLLFVTGGFIEHPAYGEILLSGIVGKVAAAAIYALILMFYLSRVGSLEESSRDLGDLFQVLTYRQKYEALRVLAARDPLTGAYNRGFLEEMLRSQLAAARRSGAVVSVMMIDIDHFKPINDTYGHAEGDRALRVIARALTQAARASDFVCRYGGEEFCLILPGTSLDNATLFAGRICAEVPEACEAAGIAGGTRVSVTIGISAFPADAATAEALMEVADRRMYQGKQDGRDRFVAK